MSCFLVLPGVLLVFTGLSYLIRGHGDWQWILIMFAAATVALGFFTALWERVEIDDDLLVRTNIFRRQVIPLKDITYAYSDGYAIRGCEGLTIEASGRRIRMGAGFGRGIAKEALAYLGEKKGWSWVGKC